MGKHGTEMSAYRESIKETFVKIEFAIKLKFYILEIIEFFFSINSVF